MSSIDVVGIRQAQTRLRKLPKQLETGRKQALTRTGRIARKDAIARLSKTGIKKRPLQRALQAKPANRRFNFALVRSAAVRVPIRDWHWRFVQVDATRAYVEVQDGLDGSWSRPYAFVNPRGRGQVPLARYPNSAGSTQNIENPTFVELRTGALIVIGGRGWSLKRPFAQWALSRGTITKVENILADEMLAVFARL